jgi:EGF-like domain.
LYGGFSDNQLFNDTWYFNINENRWIEKTSFVYASFPQECQDDITKIWHDDDCIELQYPQPLLRASNNLDSYPQVLPYSDQPQYVPDPEFPFYFGIVENAEEFVASLKEKQQLEDKSGGKTWSIADVEMKEGTPIAPYAASAPRQFAKQVKIEYNVTLSLNVWEWCNSVAGEPTRGKLVDGMFGRSNETVTIPQPRRQTVGWDGCRELQWVVPSSRSMHSGILVERYNMVIIYGGRSYQDRNHHFTGRNPLTGHFNNVAFNTRVADDMWLFGIDNCPRNCSNAGICNEGFCECDPGYYGLDCSNITCPGTVCYYDENHVQHCEHCCYDGYSHSHNEYESYVAGISKIPCHPLEGGGGFTGASNGICDGFGTCQCAPPFLGEDCSIRDCKDNCNGNGYCSIEFPVSRCICNEGYTGEIIFCLLKYFELICF